MSWRKSIKISQIIEIKNIIHHNLKIYFMQLIARVTIKILKGKDFFNTTSHDDLLNHLRLQDDKEGFPGRLLKIGTEFTIPTGDYAEEGTFKVVNIYSFIQTEHQGEIGEENYNWNYHVVYEVERF